MQENNFSAQFFWTPILNALLEIEQGFCIPVSIRPHAFQQVVFVDEPPPPYEPQKAINYTIPADLLRSNFVSAWRPFDCHTMD